MSSIPAYTYYCGLTHAGEERVVLQAINITFHRAGAKGFDIKKSNLSATREDSQLAQVRSQVTKPMQDYRMYPLTLHPLVSLLRGG